MELFFLCHNISIVPMWVACVRITLINTYFRLVFHRVLKFLQTLRVVQNNEPIRDKLKQYREAYNYGTETGLGSGEDENLVNSVCSEVRYPCRSTQKSLQRSTRALVDFAGFWSRLQIRFTSEIFVHNDIIIIYQYSRDRSTRWEQCAPKYHSFTSEKKQKSYNLLWPRQKTFKSYCFTIKTI